MRTIITIALGLSLAFAATAQAQQRRSEQDTPGTVPYFIMHNAERHAAERRCAMSTGWSAQCQAAQKAGDYISLAERQQRVNAGRFGVGSVDSPLFYDMYPIARMTTLQACEHPNGGIQPSAQACQAARISAGR